MSGVVVMSDLIVPKSDTYPSKFVDVWPYEQDYAYDIECFPNFFSLTAIHMVSDQVYYFEISQWRDDCEQLNQFIYYLHNHNCRLLGFNNISYDYWVLHWVFMQLPYWSVTPLHEKYTGIYERSSSFFNMDKDELHQSKIWPNEHVVYQVDIAAIQNFLGRVSLKVMEINMRSKTVKELPVKAGSILTDDEAHNIRIYNKKDVVETIKVFKFSLGEVQLRAGMTDKFGFDFTNNSEPSLGENYFKLKFIDAGANVKLKSPRDYIHVKDIIFPYIRFNNPEFQKTLDFLNTQVIEGTKDASYPKPEACGIGWQFGKGGMHGSILASVVREDDEYEIIDVDVTSFYPRTAMVNGLFPEHLGELFCEIYGQVFDMRKLYDKGTMENLCFKLALNAAYGKSNSAFSFLYDPKFTMTITINGQLMLCMLGEWLSQIPSLSMIQANTDGVTFRVKRMYRESVMSVCRQWEQVTGLELEDAYYQAMYIKDVNNYIAQTVPDKKNPTPRGGLKNKGAYAHSHLAWDKDHSSVIIARAAERELVDGIPIRTTIMECKDPFDFMIKAKVKKSELLVLRDSDGVETQIQSTTRYFVSTNGDGLVIIRPPTQKGIDAWVTGTHYLRERDGDYKVVRVGAKRPAMTYVEVPRTTDVPPNREERVKAGYLVTDCSDSDDFDWDTLNYEYYIKEARKLVDPLTV
ncbi:DNA-directed DNA polymerase, family B, multifunctional domain [Vibrio phage 2.096.O._10N.286.48.B5]|nr:DNA-directed DNA polymerase, family B, multifunctional domain [Vibrio phage 2.096.O._10N.286.48.B5]